MMTDPYSTKESIRAELKITRDSFRSLVNSLSENDFQKQSHNRGWTNGEILAHMTFGFIVINMLLPMARLWGKLPKASSKWFAWLLNVFTGPFNWFNALGARGQGKVFTRQRIEKIYDHIYFSLLKNIDSIKDEEWEHGMYFPTQWDSNFEEFMTVEKLFHYAVKHFNFHLTQISR
jgi:hypothetical protein